MDTSRRAILGALAVAPIAAMPSLAAAPANSEWDAALARARSFDEALTTSYEAEEAARECWIDTCEAIRPAMLTERPHAPLHHQLHTYPLGKVAELYEPPHGAEFGDGPAVAEAVGRYRQEREVLKVRFDVERLDQVSRECGQRWREAYDAAIETPVPTWAALAQKIELLKSGSVTDDQIELLASDAQRLLDMGARA